VIQYLVDYVVANHIENVLGYLLLIGDVGKRIQLFDIYDFVAIYRVDNGQVLPIFMLLICGKVFLHFGQSFQLRYFFVICFRRATDIHNVTRL
jgi:hypothetical protein